MKRIIALVVVLSLILCGCGGEGSSSSTASIPAEPVSPSPVESAEDFAADSLASSLEAPPELPPEDPDALGKWLWVLQDEASESQYAFDCNYTQSLTVTIDGTETSQKSTGRIQQSLDALDLLTYHQLEQIDGMASDIWYKNRTVYRSDLYGTFKAPITEIKFKQDYCFFQDVDGIDENSFTTLTGSPVEDGYQMEFSGLTPEAEEIYREFYRRQLVQQYPDLSVEVTTLEYCGSITMDTQGYPLTQENQLQIAYTIAGEAQAMESTLSVTYSGFNESVNILVPEDDESYQEVDVIESPELFYGGLSTVMNTGTLDALCNAEITISDGSSSNVYLAVDSISYQTQSYGGTCNWNTVLLYNDETVSYAHDVYSGGSGAITTPEGVVPYTSDDASYQNMIAQFIAYDAASFLYGCEYYNSLSSLLMYELGPEYIELAMEDYLYRYAPEYSLADAEAVTNHSSAVSVLFDDNGAVTRFIMEISCYADYGYEVLMFQLERSVAVTNY